MEPADLRSPAEPEPLPDSQHIGLIGGLGVGAAVIYYRALAAGCADRGLVPRMTIVHAHSPTALAHVAAGRIEEVADYLAGFVAELRSAARRCSRSPRSPRISRSALSGHGSRCRSSTCSR